MRGAHVRAVGERFMGEYEAERPGSRSRRRLSAGTFDTYEEALDAARRKRQRVLDGQSTVYDENTTVREFAPFYLRTALVGSDTRGDYTGTMNNHVLPHVGDLPFKSLRMSVYKEWRAALVAARAGDATIRKAKFVFQGLVAAAIEEGCLEHNALRDLRVKRVRRRPIDIINVEQFDRLLAELDSLPRQVYLELAIESGMRPGELAVIIPVNCNRFTNIIRVRRALSVPGKEWSDSGDRFEIHEYTKDDEERRVDISSDLMDRLWQVIDQNELGPLEIVFNPTVMGLRRSGVAPIRTPDRDVMSPESWRAIFARALKASGIAVGVTPRHMRHVHSSWLHDQGVPTVDVMDRLGHSDASVTRLYRVQSGQSSRAVRALSELRTTKPPA